MPSNVDIVEYNIGGVGNEVVILGWVSQHQVTENWVVKAIDTDQDRSESVDVCRIKIVPDLPIAIDGTTAIDIDVVASELEEWGDVLEDEFERVRLPVGCIVGELNVRLDVWKLC